MKIFPINAIDFYKADHRSQYPDGTNVVYSNFTPRSDRLAQMLGEYWDRKVVNFGLQGVIKWFLIDMWRDNFFMLDKDKAVARAKRRLDNALGKDAVTVEHIEALHDLGFLPLRIKALPEGARVNIKVPVYTVINSPGYSEFFWLVNYLESVLSAETWKSITNATIADQYKQLLSDYAEKTGAPMDFVSLQAHDFSFRGMSGMYDAAQSGAAHLTSFVGTDTVLAIDYLEDYYNADSDKDMVGVSVPATEHSVTCSSISDAEAALKETGEWCGIKLVELHDGIINNNRTLNYQKLAEKAFVKRMITQIYPAGIISLVADSFDFWRVITEIAPELKAEIMSREKNALGLAKVVFRPDSGCPVKILTGYKISNYNYPSFREAYLNSAYEETKTDAICVEGQYYPCGWLNDDDFEIDATTTLTGAEIKGAVECLWDVFGGTETKLGYKVLDEHVGLIYGDSITLQRAESIMQRLMDKGFASCNTVFGIGSYTYQYNTRDTFGMAMKATYGEVNGVGREIFKDPATDSGTKKSAKGLLRVEHECYDYVLYDQQTKEQEAQGAMELVFQNGVLFRDTSLNEIRERLTMDVSSETSVAA